MANTKDSDQGTGEMQITPTGFPGRLSGYRFFSSPRRCFDRLSCFGMTDTIQRIGVLD
jgi:hypothetical protein